VKVFETKIYIRFISWFITVSLLPIASLFIAVYFFNRELFYSVFSQPSETRTTIFFGIFIAGALVLLLSLVATRLLSKSITRPIQSSVFKLSKVVDDLFKSLQNLSELSNNSSELSQFLLSSSKAQQKGLKSGTKAVGDISNSISQIAAKTKSAASKATSVNKLASESNDRSQEVLDSLVVVKQLLTENQKLSQALDKYTQDVNKIASRVGSLAETAKFISLNVSIEASKSSFSEDFSSLVAQIRELNIISEQATQAITSLSSSMHKQIEQGRHSSDYQWKETDKTIKVVGKTINFLKQIAKNITQVTKNVQSIDKETQTTRKDSEDISVVIKDLNKEAKSLVSHVDTVTQVINQQLVLTRSLNRSSAALNMVTGTLNDLVGKK
jgi:methyl-accepting chemotaxis protein